MSEAPVTVRCLCGSINETVNLTGPLPQHKHICHCNACRYTTGVLFLSAPTLVSRPSFGDRLTSYDSSDKLTRYFCPSCGSHMLVHEHKHDKWSVCSGAVDQILERGEALEVYTSHEFVEDAVDGGLAICMLKDGKGKDLKVFAQADDEAAVSPSRYTSHQEAPPSDNDSDQDAKLRASCHCGGMNYYITRPNSSSTNFSCPWPDLIVASQTAHSANPDDVKWWVRGNKYLAGTCTCRSCRLATGVPVQTWAFVPQSNIKLEDGSPWRPDFGSVGHHGSSKDVTRDFCKTCGATVFWRSEARPELIDVSVGLLRAPEGARASNWLAWWTDRVSFCEEALDQEVVRMLARGLKRIRQEGIAEGMNLDK